jgi:hypothetical protein
MDDEFFMCVFVPLGRFLKKMEMHFIFQNGPRVPP